MACTIEDVFEGYPEIESVVFLQKKESIVILMAQTFSYENQKIEIVGAYFKGPHNESYKTFKEEDFYVDQSKFDLVESDMLASIQSALVEEKGYCLLPDDYTVSTIIIKNLHAKMHMYAVEALKPSSEKGRLSKEDFESVKKWGKGFGTPSTVKTVSSAKVVGHFKK